jgi:hypothetical protein
MGSPDFNVLAVARMQFLLYFANIHCPRISVSLNTVSVPLMHGGESARMLACQVQIMSE